MRAFANVMFGLLAAGLSGASAAADASSAAVTIRCGSVAKPISADLFGIFFEDLNYAADGGLYAELVQNRSFEYTPRDNKAWNAQSAWAVVLRGDACGSAEVLGAEPLHANNPHYAVLAIDSAGKGVGLASDGFDGIPLKAGESYEFSLFARRLSTDAIPLAVRLERATGELLGEALFSVASDAWSKHVATIQARADEPDARLVVLATGTGRLALDMVSLFPKKTFRGRQNGLRADLAQVIADLHPKFVRFPGGCLAHGDGLDNLYRWKATIGPVEQRTAQPNIWRYHQTAGLGYFEYFQFCEDIGAKPLPVVAAGVCCQNAGNYIPGAPKGQQHIPMEQMPAYVQEVLDLIEYANGPVNSVWGARRAAAGHPKPFGLNYLGVGNEDHITPAFRERFKLIFDAVRARHPEITVIGTVGPFHSGPDYDAGWRIADELKVPLVDEHYYEAPQWFLNNATRYDAYDRARSKVYLGEYAAHDKDRKNTLRSALAEAAYMTALERNGDVVQLASYAPLLAKQGHTQWRPDLIYFDNQTVTPSINYYVQQLFCMNAGGAVLTTEVSGGDPRMSLAVSVVQGANSDLIIKLVNPSPQGVTAQIDLSAAGAVKGEGSCTVLQGEPLAENACGRKAAVLPQTSPLAIAPVISYTVQPYSLSVIRARLNGEAASGKVKTIRGLGANRQ